MAFPTGWSAPYQIQSDHTKVAGSSNLTDFPALISSANLSASFYSKLRTGEINNGHLVSDANLVAYWRMEGNSNDSEGSNNGTDTSISYSSGNGKFTQGAGFNGSSSRILTALLTSATTNVSVSLWIYPTSVNQLGLFLHNGTSSNGWGFGMGSTTEATGNHLGLFKGGIAYVDLGEAFPTANVWYHVVLTRDGTTWKGYVNGRQTTNTHTGNPNTPTTQGTIGSLGTLYYFAGNIDDVAFFSRTLTAGEVKAIYTGGADLRITTDLAGTTEVPYEIVSLDTVGNTCEIWAKVPTLDYDDPTSLYLWAGNSSATHYEPNATYGSQNVWSNYKGVYHLSELLGNRNDSTANALTLTDTNTVASATGQIGTGADFETSNSEKLVTTNDGFNSTASQTFQSWFKPESTTVDAGIMGNFDASSTVGRVLKVDSSAPYFSNRGGTMGTKTATHPSTLSNGTWYFISGVLDVTNDTISIIVNGTKTTTTGATGDPGSSTQDFTLGSAGGLNAYLDGVLDESRVIFGVLSDDWIATEYNNQSDPASFWLEIGSSSPSLSPSLSPSASQSPSASPSLSPSASQSRSPSSSQSPSSSVSLSESRSSSASPSPSSSPSVSESRSPSSSQSPSSSISLSPSRSVSSSDSPSPSVSESRSPSTSVSSSPSPSASPSQGYTDYTRGNYVALPTNDDDLETNYTAQDVIDVSTDDGVRVDQDGSNQFMIHQFRNFVADQPSCQLHWNGQTTLSPNVSTVYLQIYNRDTEEWETLDSDSSSMPDVDLNLFGDVLDLTNYKDASDVITARVYQEAM